MILRAALALLLTLGLAGCFAPDVFDARLSLKSGGRVQLVYTGRLTHLPSAMESAAGRPSPRDADAITAQMRRDPKMRTVSNLGDGVFEIEYVATLRLAVGETFVFPAAGEAWLTVTRESETRTRLTTRGFSADESRALRALGVGVIGDLTHLHVILLEPPLTQFAYDTDPAQSAQTRVRMLDMLAAQRVPIIAYHFPWPGIGHIEKVGEGFKYHPAPMIMQELPT